MQAKRNIPEADSLHIRFEFKTSIDKQAILPKNFTDTLAKINILLNKVFSSAEFKDSLYSHTFNDSSYSKSKANCFIRVINEQTHRVDGSAVYGNLTADSVINIELAIRRTEGKTRTQGFSNACIYKITSNDFWMKPDQLLAFRYVRHIAHEFTHIRGYRHDNKVATAYKWGRNPGEDPAYGVGRIVGNILERWNKAGIIKL
ncbi:hypothetical protein FW774_07710 [Pedobacter sp. BS3]|uniref:hypothetical protein n=1 Tax=Pedobacter sp. BS3 TaxID=2567937 RepID=UPI0011EF2DB1|nr:hypothetical protein [Pedobacter sp. BS3]TZF84854.1 hypothetical protein FW774_07710 [Pedobacter sp. BS3]